MRKMFGSFPSVYFSCEGLVGEIAAFRQSMKLPSRSVSHWPTCDSGQVLCRVRFYSTQLAQKQESLTVHLLGTIHMLSQGRFCLLQACLVKQPPTHSAVPIIAILINLPMPPPLPPLGFPRQASDFIFWPVLMGSTILSMCDCTWHFKSWTIALKFSFPSHWLGMSISDTEDWSHFIFFKQIPFGGDFIYLFLERGEGREKQRESNINVWLPLTWPPLGA